MKTFKKTVIFLIICIILQMFPSVVQADLPVSMENNGLSVGNAPIGMNAGDYNGDGKADLAVCNSESNTISILIGNKTGTFNAKVDYGTGIMPWAVKAAHLNNDGKMDLAVVNHGASTVSVLTGKGDGTFNEKADFGTGHYPYGLAMGDFNADGNTDMAVTNYQSNTVSVLMGDGNAAFNTKVDYTTGINPVSIETGDYNGDNKPDLAVVNYGSNTVSVLTGKGDGTFNSKIDTVTNSYPYGIVSDDLDMDGIMDFAVTSQSSNVVSILIGNGDGTFKAKVDYGTGNRPCGITNRDLSGDGKTDLVIANNLSNTISVLKGNGDGTFNTDVEYATGLGPWDIVTGNFNSDPDPDIITSNYSGENISLLTKYVEKVNQSTPTPQQSTVPSVTTQAPSPTAQVQDPLSGISISGDELPKGEQTTDNRTKDIKVGIVVDGNKKEETAKANVEVVEDKVIVTVVVDKEAAMDKLKEAQKTVTIPVKGNIDTFIGELDGDMIKTVENKAATLEIKTDTATYALPASEIRIEKIVEQLGSNISLKDVGVKIKIEKSNQETVKVVENSGRNQGFTIVAPPMEFNVTVSSGDKKVEIKKFESFIERTVAIPDGVDASKITTGVVVEQDGSVRHVPTRVVIIDGKYYARINSLTNSTYSVVWHPVEFKEAENHWAKASLNDMGSRMVINGVADGIIEPDRDITRSEFAAIVVRGLGLKEEVYGNTFKDVKADDWYSGFIQTAYEYNIISGYDNGNFGLADKITREQAMTMIARAMKISKLKSELKEQEQNTLLAGFVDSNMSSDWAWKSIAECIKAGIVMGKSGGVLAPGDNITRAEACVIIQRLLQKSNLI